MQTPSLIFPTIWSPPSLATCPPAITYHAIVVCRVVGVVTETSRPEVHFFYVPACDAAHFLCAVHIKNENDDACKFDTCAEKQKKMCEQGQYLRESM